MNRSKSLQSHPLQSLPFLIGVDVLFAITLILLMATGVQENFAHEWLGMAAFLLFVVHQVQHKSWWKALFRGKYSSFRLLKTLVVACLSICFLGLAASSFILSREVFSWLPTIYGSFWARPVHLLFSHWAFLLAFVHAGLCLPKITSRLEAFSYANGLSDLDSSKKQSHSSSRQNHVPAIYQRRISALFKVKTIISYALHIALVLLGIVYALELNLPEYLIPQTDFFFAGSNLSLMERCIPYLFIGLGTYSLIWSLTSLFKKVR